MIIHLAPSVIWYDEIVLIIKAIFQFALDINKCKKNIPKYRKMCRTYDRVKCSLLDEHHMVSTQLNVSNLQYFST